MKNITQHYQKVIGGELQKIHSDEWDMDIYFRETYSFKDEAKIVELQAQGKIVDALVESIVVKAIKKDGSRMFTEADRMMLMNEADPKVIVKIASAINNANLTRKIEEGVIAKE